MSDIQFHFCSLSNRDISFRYDGCGKVQYSYTNSFNFKGKDYGEFSISLTEVIRNAFRDKDGRPYPIQGFDMKLEAFYTAPDLSQRLKYLIVLRNIHDLNEIIKTHNTNPKHANFLLRIINVVLKFFTCGYFTFFDEFKDYKRILDSLGVTREDPNNISFASHLVATSLFDTRAEAISAFIKSARGRDLGTYFGVWEQVPKTLEELYRLEEGHCGWAPLYMCGSDLDKNGYLPSEKTRSYVSGVSHICPDSSFQN